MSNLTQSMRLKLQIFLGALALFGLQFLFALHLRMNPPPLAEPESEKVEDYNPELFKVMSFGQLPAVIDWMWIKTLQDPVITHVAKGNHPAIFYTLDLITQLDPAFQEAYVAGATLVSVIRNDGPGALHLLQDGEMFRTTQLPSYDLEFRSRFWSNEWQLPLLLAYVYLFDMDDMPHATEAFKTAEAIEGSPSYLKDLVQRLEKPGGQYEVGLRLIDFMISGTRDPEVIGRLSRRRHLLEVDYFLYVVNQKHAKHERIQSTDPWGGKISVGPDGKVTTTTPHQRVFGLE